MDVDLRRVYRDDTELVATARQNEPRPTPTPPTPAASTQYRVAALVDGVAGRWSALREATRGTDYDSDNDNLIDITTLAQLDAVRHDLNGVGDVDDASDPATEGSDAAIYAAAFPNDAVNMGCATTCEGYELMNGLDFATIDTSSPPTWYDATAGWTPIGDSTLAFTGDFEGNGNTISNLFINRTAADVGLFGGVGSGGTVKNLGLVDANVRGNGTGGTDGYRVGALVGDNDGAITNSYATGAVTGKRNVGGLAGINNGSITASYAAASVTLTGGDDNVGGLVGNNNGGTIITSYATGAVTGDRNNVGSLAGRNTSRGTVTRSYAAGPVSGSGNNVGGLVGNNSNGTINKGYFDSDVSGRSGGIGRTTAQLQTPTSNTAPLRRLNRRRVGLRH